MSGEIKGLRLFTCGHSFHWFTPVILKEIAASAGIQGHVQVGESGIGGSAVHQHWDLPEETNTAKAALRAGTVDVLTLSPLPLRTPPDEGIGKFAELALTHNPQIRITVQESWLPNDRYAAPAPQQEETSTNNPDATNLVALRREHEEYFRETEAQVRSLNQQLGRQVLLVVPVGQAVLALREWVVAGQAHGLQTQGELFIDPWGHPGSVIKVLVAYCHYAVIYRRSPVGLKMPMIMAGQQNPLWTEKLNRFLQELAWDAVVHHPLSRVAK